MATLYLHIGTTKTGTTSIQKFLLANREALAAKGYCLPKIPKEIIEFREHRNGRFLVEVNQSADGSFESPEAEAMWWKGIRYVASQFEKYPNVILTDEGIWNASGLGRAVIWKNLKRAAGEHNFQVKIIVYLRRQDQYISSAWAQWVKLGDIACGSRQWEDSLAKSDEWITMDYHRHLERIAAVMGRESIIARIYDREKFLGGDVIQDFLSVLGLRMDDGFTIPNREANPSITGNVLEIKRILNTIPGQTDDIKNMMKRIALDCNGKDHSQYSIYSREERDAILQKYAESNRLLARDYFGDENLQLFSPPEEIPPKWDVNNPDMHEDIIRFLGTVLLRQEREISELRNRFFLKRKLKRFANAKLKRLRKLFHAKGSER